MTEGGDLCARSRASRALRRQPVGAMASLLLALRQLLALGVLTAVALLWGRWAMALILGSSPPFRKLEGWAFAVAFGLSTLGAALFVLGLLGWLTPLAVVLLAALGVALRRTRGALDVGAPAAGLAAVPAGRTTDRKSTRLNSSHPSISYAV